MFRRRHPTVHNIVGMGLQPSEASYAVHNLVSSRASYFLAGILPQDLPDVAVRKFVYSDFVPEVFMVPPGFQIRYILMFHSYSWCLQCLNYYGNTHNYKVINLDNWVFKDLIFNAYKWKKYVSQLKDLKNISKRINFFTSQYLNDTVLLANHILKPSIFYLMDEGTANFTYSDIREKNKKVFSAKKFYSLISYSSLITGSLKIKKSYISQPSIYVQNILFEHKKLFPNSYLRKLIHSHIANDNNLVTSFKNNTSIDPFKFNIVDYPEVEVIDLR